MRKTTEQNIWENSGKYRVDIGKFISNPLLFDLRNKNLRKEPIKVLIYVIYCHIKIRDAIVFKEALLTFYFIILSVMNTVLTNQLFQHRNEGYL